MKPNKDPEVDGEVFHRTMEEVAEEKALGPFTEQEVDNILGAWAPVRRAGLAQSSGIRQIDVFTECGHNATSFTHE